MLDYNQDVEPHPVEDSEFLVQKKKFYEQRMDMEERIKSLNIFISEEDLFQSMDFKTICNDSAIELLDQAKIFSAQKRSYQMAYHYMLLKYGTECEVELQTKTFPPQPLFFPPGNSNKIYNEILLKAGTTLLHTSIISYWNNKWEGRMSLWAVGRDPDHPDLDEETVAQRTMPVLASLPEFAKTAKSLVYKMEQAVLTLVSMSKDEGENLKRRSMQDFVNRVKVLDRAVDISRFRASLSLKFIEKEEDRLREYHGERNFRIASLRKNGGYGSRMRRLRRKFDKLSRKYEEYRNPSPLDSGSSYEEMKYISQEKARNLIDYFENIGLKMEAGEPVRETEENYIIKYPTLFMEGLMKM